MMLKSTKKLSLIIALTMSYGQLSSQVIFEDNFNDQPDWTSGLAENDKGGSPAGLPDRVQRAATHTIPTGWYSLRQAPRFAPSKGQLDKHEVIELLGSNSSWAKGGTGKSLVFWRNSQQTPEYYWSSDAILLKHLPTGYDEIYVQIWIRFGDNFAREYMSGTKDVRSKLFRITSWKEDLNSNNKEYGYDHGLDNGPVVLWSHIIKKTYGLRNSLAFRGGPHGDNYSFTKGDFNDIPFNLVNRGDLPMTYTGNPKGTPGSGNNPNIPDRLNGGFLSTSLSSVESHDQIFGPGDSWTKMTFHVKMNSAPDVKDGVFEQWMNDEPIVSINDIPWIRTSANENMNAQWNVVALGGNDYFKHYPNATQHQEWYTMDDVVIYEPVDTTSVYWANSPKDGRLPFDYVVGNQTTSIDPLNKEVESSKFEVFPNPSVDGLFEIKISDTKISEGAFSVTDIRGKIIHRQLFNDAKINLDLSKFSGGIYFVLLEHQEKIERKKIVILK